jgi:hypothetical protein
MSIKSWQTDVVRGLWNNEILVPASEASTALSVATVLSSIAPVVSNGVYTLAAGIVNQIKLFTFYAGGNGKTATLTPVRLVGGTKFTCTKNGDGVVLRYNGWTWEAIAFIGSPTWDGADIIPRLSDNGGYEYQILLATSSLSKQTWTITADKTFDPLFNITLIDCDTAGGTLEIAEGVAGQYRMVTVISGGYVVDFKSDFFSDFVIRLQNTGDGAVVYNNGAEYEIVALFGRAQKVVT